MRLINSVEVNKEPIFVSKFFTQHLASTPPPTSDLTSNADKNIRETRACVR